MRCGTVIVTVVPTPRVLFTLIVPPFNSIFRFAIVSPSPVPVALVEKYGSKIRASASAIHADAGVGSRSTGDHRRARLGTDREPPAARHGVQRVFDHVRERAREKRAVDLRLRQIVWHASRRSRCARPARCDKASPRRR